MNAQHSTPRTNSTFAVVARQPYIVVAEDNPDLRNVLQIVLTHDGREVVVAASGHELIATLERARREDRPPALIVSDVHMPGPSGLDVMSKVRAWGWTVPVVFMTASADEALLSRASRLRNTVVFRKPFTIDDLLTAVGCFVDNADALPQRGPHHPEGQQLVR